MTIREFVDELSADSPAPGGGSVAALAGCLSASLSAMVGTLTWPKQEYKEHRQEMMKLPVAAQKLKDFFLLAIDRDTEAFNKLMACFGMPKETKEEMKARSKSIGEATRGAIDVPMEVLHGTLEALELAKAVAERGNRNSISDAGVAALMAKACADGAYYNIKINLGAVSDKDYVSRTLAKADEIRADAHRRADEIADIINSVLDGKLK